MLHKKLFAMSLNLMNPILQLSKDVFFLELIPSLKLALASHHMHINFRNLFPHFSIRFSQKSLDSVSVCGLFQHLLGNRNPHSARTFFLIEKTKSFGEIFLIRPKTKVRLLKQPDRLWKFRQRSLLSSHLWSEALSSFSTTTGQNCFAVLCAISFEKTVCPAPFCFARLIRPLHSKCS